MLRLWNLGMILWIALWFSPIFCCHQLADFFTQFLSKKCWESEEFKKFNVATSKKHIIVMYNRDILL